MAEITGNIGGVGDTISATFTRPANTTAYTAKDVVAPAELTVSGASNATPIVMTTSTAHGMSDGDVVTQASVGGNTNANGTYYVKVSGYSTVTYALYSDRALATAVSGNSNYTSGGTVQRLVRLANVVKRNGGTAVIMKARLGTNLVTFLDQIVAHLYSDPVAAIADNAVFTLLNANWGYREGKLTFAALATEGSGSDCASAQLVPDGVSLPLMLQASALNRDLYVQFEDLGTGTPASGQTFNFELMVSQDL